MGILDLFSGSDSGIDAAIAANRKNASLYSNLATPQFKDFTPEQMKNITANYSTINEDPLIKSAQMSALAKMSGLADTGLTDADMAGYQQARDIGNQAQASGQAAALQNAQARGVGGSGLEFAMREMANQGAASKAQNAGLQQAADAARQKALYQQAYGSQLSGMANQENNLAGQNAGIINQFNAMNTNNQNATNRANVQANNQAFQYNQGQQQQNFQNQMSKANAIAGVNNQAGQIGAAQDAINKGKQGAIGGLIGAGIGYYGTGTADGAKTGAGIGQMVGGF